LGVSYTCTSGRKSPAWVKKNILPPQDKSKNCYLSDAPWNVKREGSIMIASRKSEYLSPFYG